jgi:hypothetical protein
LKFFHLLLASKTLEQEVVTRPFNFLCIDIIFYATE